MAFKTCFVVVDNCVTLKYANMNCVQCFQYPLLCVVEIEMLEVLRDCNLQHHFCFNFYQNIPQLNISATGDKSVEKCRREVYEFLSHISHQFFR